MTRDGMQAVPMFQTYFCRMYSCSVVEKRTETQVHRPACYTVLPGSVQRIFLHDYNYISNVIDLS